MTPSITAFVGTFVETERDLPLGDATVPAGAVGEVTGVGESIMFEHLRVTWPGLEGEWYVRPQQLRPSSREAWAAYSLRATRRGPWVALRTERREGLLVIPAQTVGLLEAVPDGSASVRVDVDAGPMTEVVEGALRQVLDVVVSLSGTELVMRGDWAQIGRDIAAGTMLEAVSILYATVTREVSIELPPWEPDPGAVSVRLRALWEPVRGG